MIEIKTLDRKSLLAYLESDEFRHAPFIPISKHRAISHANNPRADDEDVLMLLAYQTDELVGYLGVLADWIFEQDGTKHKCGWLSCMWIDPNFRGRGISKQLVRSALNHWDQKILVTEFTTAAKGLYDKVGAFKDLQILEGIRIYHRLDLAKILPQKKEFYGRIMSLLYSIDYISNLIFDLRFLLPAPKIMPPKIEYLQQLDKETEEFIESKSRDHLFLRNKLEINWILKYPWITSAPHSDHFSSRYHFSSIDKAFSFVCLKLRDSEGKICGFLIFAKRDRNLKLPYCYYGDSQLSEVVQIIKVHLRKWRINTFTIFNRPLANQLAKESIQSIYKKKIKRHFIISRTLENFKSDQTYLIQDGDADCAFT